MQVKDIMNTDVIVCNPQTTISEASQLLKKHNISGLPVVEDGRVVGIVSEADLLKLLEVPEHGGLWLPSPFEIIEIPLRELLNWEETKHMLNDIGSKPVSEIMQKKVHVISPEKSIYDAVKLITKHKINRLPVVKDDILVGIITRGDIIKGLGRDAEQ
ncbi:MAG: CBS domain-containing protein [Methanomethylovorans sp.]|jgi:CBS domain-containing protein|nr:CBS domain-containing protein [Methanomethylovorans sp.]